jgi:starch synthase
MTQKTLEILAVASEIYPLIKTGGLADVVGALPAALGRQGVAVTTLVPGYPAVLTALEKSRAVLVIPDLFGGPATVLRGAAAGLDLLVLSASHLYERPGNPYLGPDGRDWPDNGIRFAALAAIAASIGRGAIRSCRPAVLHAHDWQAGLTAAYLAHGGPQPPASVMTVHREAFAWVPYPTAANPTGHAHLARLVGRADLQRWLDREAERIDLALVREWTHLDDWAERVLPALLYR